MRKKLFAVIMSAMMMITFMPSMAFAADVPVTVTKVTWDKTTYATATVEGTYNTTEKFSQTVGASQEFNATTGKTTATLAAALPMGSDMYNFTYGSGAAARTATFYDLNGASIVRYISSVEYPASVAADDYFNMINQSYTWKDPSFEAGKDVFDLFGGDTQGYVKLVKPASATEAGGTTVGKAYVLGTTADDDIEFTAKLPRYEKYEASKNYEVAISAKATASATTPIINADKMVSAHNVYIDSSNFTKVALKIDGSSALNEVTLATALPASPTAWNTTYTGDNQKIEVVTKGLKVEYSVDEGKTWTATAPEMKAVKDGYTFGVKVTNDKNVSKYANLKVVVNPAKGYISFKKKTYSFAPKTVVKPSDLVQFNAYEYDATSAVAAKKVAMNSDDTKFAKEFIDKYIVIEDLDSENPVNEDEVEVALNKTALKAAKLTDEKLFYFVENFGNWADSSENFVNVDESTEVSVFFGLEYNDITAPNKTITYKAKKGKLAKTKTYKLTKVASADFGSLSFTKMNTKGGSKIAVAKSGKVTIKKGLKKGTYKVKIKVKAPGTKANMYLTVKVK